MRRAALIAALLANAAPASAEVTALVIDKQAAISSNGGAAYEALRGRVFGEVDPALPANAIIQDIALAPRNARGRVEYVATFTLHRPLEAARNSGLLFLALPNRGNRIGGSARAAPGQADPAFYQRGDAVLWLGWQGDLATRPSRDASAAGMATEALQVPVARRPDGSPLTGRYLMRFPAIGAKGISGTVLKLDQGLAGSLAYPPASYDTNQAEFTGGPPEDVNGKPTGPRHAIAPADWQWWNCKADASPEAATAPGDLCIKLSKGAFDPAQVYQLVFNARDPLVLGLGLAALRDATSFFRNGTKDNPLAGQVRHVVTQGQSQVGNLVRTFITLGFNADEQGRRVWDGANSHIGGRQLPLNYRFATPGSSTTLFMPGSEGVMWWGKAGAAGKSALDRCTASKSCPKIFETFGGAELWNQRFTPDLVGLTGTADIALPANVRRYYFPGTTHGGGQGGFRLSQPRGECSLPLNPNPQADQMRALTNALIDWVVKDKPPPTSAWPTLAKGDLVRAEAGALRMPAIPGAPSPLGKANPVLVYDYGNTLNTADQIGVLTRMPPAIRRVAPAFVAQVNSDGNETAGLRSVQLQVPLGSYFGWNTFPAGPYAGRLCSFNGGFVSFAKTAKDRAANGDPRLSIEERYPSRAIFVGKVREAVGNAQADGFLLAEDGEQIVRDAIAATETGDLSFLKP